MSALVRFGALASVVVSFATGVGGCRPRERAADASPAPSAPGRTSGDRRLDDRILLAEYARDESAVPPDALVSRDVRVRRLAARAVARIANDRVAKELEKGLADEDAEVVAWSAYGLGYTCRLHEEETVRRLVVRAASLPESLDGNPDAISAGAAIADALARCGGAAVERTLVAWLEGPKPRSRAAALALGRLAGDRHRLSDEAIVALLDGAATSGADGAALYPLSRLDTLSDVASKRLVEVAKAAISAGGESRSFAIRALGSAGEPAVSELGDALADQSFSASDRAAAAAALGRVGTSAKPAVARALASIVGTDKAFDDHFVSLHFAPLAAVLAAPLWPNAEARPPLSRLADAPLADSMSPGLRRRIVALRCGAAAALAGSASRSAKLVACDPDRNGRAGALATLRVLDRGKLTGARFDAWQKLASHEDPGVRRAALAFVPTHPEMPTVVDLLARSIAASEPGVAAQAARVVALEPRRASAGSLLDLAASPETSSGRAQPETAANPKVVEALAHAMDAERPPDQIEVRVALMDAAAALGNLSLKSRIERYCASDNVTLRTRAERALSRFGQGASCPKGKPPPVRQFEGPPPHPASATLTFVTDAGPLALTVDPTSAPFAADRLTSLARSGFYDGIRIHRVTPGFVAQFGDRVGDGSGGAGQQPLPCETSPVEFSPLSVGVALSGRDTGSSQIFVTLASEPYLDGDYALVGRAGPEWAGVAEGDVIQRVEVR